MLHIVIYPFLCITWKRQYSWQLLVVHRKTSHENVVGTFFTFLLFLSSFPPFFNRMYALVTIIFHNWNRTQRQWSRGSFTFRRDFSSREINDVFGERKDVRTKTQRKSRDSETIKWNRQMCRFTEGGNRKRRSGKKNNGNATFGFFPSTFIHFILLKAQKRKKGLISSVLFSPLFFSPASQLIYIVCYTFEKGRNKLKR